MDLNQVAGATITWARSPDEETVLRRSLGRLAAAGRPVAVGDAGASAPFTDFLKGVAAFAVTTATVGGLVAQVQASLTRAAMFGRPFILYTEPDKQDFFERQLRAFIEEAPAGDDVGVVLASRSRDSFDTFPATQRYTEGVINELCGQAFGIAGDYSYGPFLMHVGLLPQLLRFDAAIGWGWRQRTFLQAHREGRRVLHVAGDRPCPADQREEDDADRAHRIRQLSQNLLGLLD